MSKLEAIVACAKDGVDIFDLRSGSFLHSFNVPLAGQPALLDDEHILVNTADRSGLQVWSWKTGQQKTKSYLSDKTRAVAVSPDGYFIAAGTAGGQLQVWDALTGELLRVWEAHYKAVSALAFTADGSFLVSGGEDAIVNVWLLGDCLAPADASESVSGSSSSGGGGECTPYAQWSDHALTVTSVFCSPLGPAGRIVTASLDRTCRVWEVASKSLIASFVLPCGLHCAAMDPAETVIAAAGADGNIYSVPLLPAPVLPDSALFAVPASSSSDNE